jgi:FG-GAP repeat
MMNRVMKLGLLTTMLTAASLPAHAQISRLSRADTTTGSFFGAAVALDDNRILVGSTGTDTCGPNSGAAFIYGLDEHESWQLEATLTAGDCEPDEYFGRAVSLEGGVAVVTSFVPTPFAVRSNAVYVFERGDDGVWTQTARLSDPVPADDGPFASSATVNGGRILVTSTGDTASGRFGGSASMFEKGRDGRWLPRGRLRATHDARYGVFGTSSALDGTRAVVTGSTYGRNSPGSAHVFDETDGNWEWTSRIEGVDDYFIPVALDGDRLLLGQTREGKDHTGRAVIYELLDGEWRRVVDLKPESPYPSGGFGSAVALSGNVAAVVGFDEQLKLEFNIDRVVFVFRLEDDGLWHQRQTIDVGEVYFGAALALDGDTAVIGKASQDSRGDVFVAKVR